MRALVFAYHNMGIAGLEALLRNRFSVEAIFTHEDDPSENRWFASVKEWAQERNLPVYTPPNVNEPTWVKRINEMKPDCIFSFYYRQLLSESILNVASCGAYNLHGSLLPAYRGRVPVNWVLIHGEKVTGVTLHYMVKKADAGDIVGQKRVEIDFYDTAETLFGKLCRAAGELLDEVLPLIKTGRHPRFPQDESKATTFSGRRPEDGRIDWQQNAISIYNLVRAVTRPYPGAFAFFPDGRKIMVWWCLPDERFSFSAALTGEVRLEDRFVYVQTGRGVIRLLDVEVGEKVLTGRAMYEYFSTMGKVRLI
ncbi:MAG: formyltransferase [Syntrophales bacterium]|nr:formyltransferase [Syntrophales bacterium]